MATVNDTITISRERRPCYVDGERALFHCWEQYSEIVAPSIAVGGHNGGEIRRVYGIVEFQDGKIGEYVPCKIRFADGGEFDEYEWREQR